MRLKKGEIVYGDKDKKWIKIVFWILLALMLLFTVMPMMGLMS
jgi:uncharacterized membrane protein YdfJ with MMPL/SSD domain